MAPPRSLAQQFAHEERASGDHCGRQMPFIHQPLRSIDVGRQLLEQIGALDKTPFDLRPFLRADDQRHDRQRPGAFVLVTGDTEGQTQIRRVAGGNILHGHRPAFGYPRQPVRDGPPAVGHRLRGIAVEIAAGDFYRVPLKPPRRAIHGTDRLRLRHGSLQAGRPPQVKRVGKFAGQFLGRNRQRARRVSVVLEPRLAPRFGLVVVDRHGIVVAPARVRDLIDAAAQRAVVPRVVDVERQRSMRLHHRMQTLGRGPGLVANTADSLARRYRCQRHPAARSTARGHG